MPGLGRFLRVTRLGAEMATGVLHGESITDQASPRMATGV